MNSAYLPVKRAFDFIAALLGFAFLWPLFAIIAFAIALDSGMPLLYRQERLTFHEKTFTALKFRTMVKGAREIQKKGTPLEKLITRTGAPLRETHFDEFPQLWNVLLGEMSLIGPRPLIREWELQMPKGRLECKAGMTGLGTVMRLLPHRRSAILRRLRDAQHLRNENNIYSFDVYYCAHASARLDFIILCETFRLVAGKVAGVFR
ncbi:sugar transferase [Candidatus Micrarchaeota archaeon]|nr:sugar transferase [Candidatus Micrarchaeota archaeon]MBU1940047.1 sugar transferase [Candidatus Micrarchaeota archaeon]